MQIYTGNPSGSKDKTAMLVKYELGVMLSVGPSSSSIGNLVKNDIPIAIDNGAYMAWRKGYPYAAVAGLFRDLLKKAYLANVNPDFIVCPDLVGQGRKSLSFSLEWAKGELVGTPRLALAVQDGLTPGDLTANERRPFSHIFVGGTTKGDDEAEPGRDWKWETAPAWVEFAHKHNMRCHIARCGTYDALLKAQRIGADSVDSVSWVKNDNPNSWDHLEQFRNGPKQVDVFESDTGG